MGVAEDFRRLARVTWSAGDWDSFSRLLAPVGALVLDRIGVEPGMDLLDVGTGSGGNVAIPAARRGARVVGSDVTPELFEHARRRAAAAGVEVKWVDADAQRLPFEDASFDRVTSTFAAMFAPDHFRTAAELVRVCRPGGRIAMTTWIDDGFPGALFRLANGFMPPQPPDAPPPPPNVQLPPLWGLEEHVLEVFGAAGVSVILDRETVDYDFPSVEDAMRSYAEDFGPFVIVRAVLAPLGRWEDFLQAFGDLVRRFNLADDGAARIRPGYFLIRVER